MKSILSSKALQTSAADTVKGFIWQSEQKLPQAAAFVNVSNYFVQKIPTITSWDVVFNDSKLKGFVIAASCLSKKSLNHINSTEQRKIIESLIDINKLKDSSYLNQIQARFFLTCGDSLGGTMRNVVGQSAQLKLTKLIIEKLQQKGQEIELQQNSTDKVISITWNDRFLCFDKKPLFINKSVDFILIKSAGNIESPQSYLACGELKGGIDPAGADEHWKTARAALDRITDVFNNLGATPPKLFFVGAAIEAAMANEIFAQLSTSKLYAAANLNHETQIAELVDLLIAL